MMLRVSDQERLLVWAGSLRAWWHGPNHWLGWGPSNFLPAFRMHRGDAYVKLLTGGYWAQGDAHNLVLNALVMVGIVGTVAGAYLLYRSWRATDRMGRAVLAGAVAVGMVEPLPYAVWLVVIPIVAFGVRDDGPAVGMAPRTLATGVAAVLLLLRLAGDVCYERAAFHLNGGRFHDGTRWLGAASVLDPTAAYIGMGERVTWPWARVGPRMRRWHPHDFDAWQAETDELRRAGQIPEARAALMKAYAADPWANVLQQEAGWLGVDLK